MRRRIAAGNAQQPFRAPAKDARPSPAANKSSATESSPTKPKRAIIVERFGIWEIEREAYRATDWLPGHQLWEDWNEIQQSLPYVGKLFAELWSIGPVLLLGFASMRFLQALLPALKLHLGGRMLQATQVAIDKRDVPFDYILGIFAQQFALMMATRILSTVVHRCSMTLSDRLRRVFDIHLLATRFRLDLATLEDVNAAREMRLLTSTGGVDRGWQALQSLVGVGTTSIEALASFTVLFNMLRERQSDRWIAATALLKPLLDILVQHARITGNFWARIVDPIAKRRDHLIRISHTSRYYKEVIALVLGPYLLQEYQEATTELDRRHVRNESPYNAPRSPFDPGQIIRDISSDIPIVLFAYQAIRTPISVPLSFAAYTLIRQTTSDFSRRIVNLLHQPSGLARQCGQIKALYEADLLPKLMQDGDVSYARNDEKPGIAIEIKNVSFTYAGGPAPVLSDVNCTIPSGSLCIIVGTNGGGKTTLMKLLDRLYDPTGGEILFNGLPLPCYRADSLRSAVGCLWQDHVTFPLSIGENIGLGDPERATDAIAVQEAADRAGCTEFIEAQPLKFEASLARPDIGSGRVRATARGYGTRPAFLQRERDEQEREVKLSGGQEQRLALARVFMREKKADLLLFDEPSASLDARAERDLFLRVLDLRGGKTIVWVSHRLHLCRHADQVIMMDGGKISEQGTHDELMKANGGYAELYRFQS